jgi:hypothetical protein
LKLKDLKKVTHHIFKKICGIYLKIIKEKTGRSQHGTGWTWKHEVVDRLCPKILTSFKAFRTTRY